jgi:hypothetical protein
MFWTARRTNNRIDIMKLRDVLPLEFFRSFMDTPAAKLLDVEVVNVYPIGGSKYRGVPWIGKHKNVCIWFELANGKAVAWNENVARGWSFPVERMKK